MSGDTLARPHMGTAAGVPYVALPPTTADADPDGSPPLIVAWPGSRRPPRTPAAFAAAMPLTGVPGWRVYLGLPEAADDATVVEQAAVQAPAAIAVLRQELDLERSPLGLAGFSIGGTVALRTLVRGEVPVVAAALIAPLRYGELTAADIAARGPVLLFVGGGADDTVPPSELAATRDQLRTAGVADVELATFRMGHALAAEPGTEARPQIAEAISVDAAITDWFRDHLGVRPRGLSDPAPARGALAQDSART